MKRLEGKYIYDRLRPCLVVFLIFIFPVDLFGQVKFEKEYRIRDNEIPAKAKQFVDSLNISARVKWYMEEGTDTKSVEAKTKRDKKSYSIEFDTLGNIQDIEIEISKDQMPDAVLKAIHAKFAHEFAKYQFVKIQVQYSGRQADLLGFMLDKYGKEAVVIKYEIVVKGKNEGRYKWYEYTFSSNGNPENRSTVVFRNTDNLEF